MTNETETKPKKSIWKKWWFWVILIILFFLLSLFSIIHKINELENKLSATGEKLSATEKTLSELHLKILYREIFEDISRQIDLTETIFQAIHENFNIVIEEVNPHLSGIKIKGKILNSSAVDHKNIKFEVKIADQTKELSILESIDSGYAREFEVYIPDVPLETRYAEIKYISSIVGYFKHF